MSSRAYLLALAALLVMVPFARGQEAEPARAAPQPVAAAAPTAAGAAARAITVFVDARLGARKDGAARAISARHAQMEAEGWRFAHLAPFVENGDLVGFFVTYVR